MGKEKKNKEWKRPMLTVVVRGDANNNLLMNCKTHASTGPSSSAFDKCNQYEQHKGWGDVCAHCTLYSLS